MVCSTDISVRGIIFRLVTILLLLSAVSSVRAELILSAPPRENAVAGQAQYDPLAAHLSSILGEKVVYAQPRGWLYYQREMRADRYDIVFDGPHFISWRIRQFNHTPVARLPGKVGFLIVTNRNNLAIKNVDDLVNIAICASAPPDISTVTVLAQLDNPARQPKLVNIKGGNDSVYQSFRDHECEAAIISDRFYAEHVTESERVRLKTVFKSAPVINQGVTVSSRVSPRQRQLIAEALTTVTQGIKPTLKRFAPDVDRMMPASRAEYDVQYKLLTDVVYGWEITNPHIVSMR